MATIKGILSRHRFLGHSYNGNPIYELSITTTEGNLLVGETLTDGIIAYEFLNNKKQLRSWKYYVDARGVVVFEEVRDCVED
jgi:hypothetical protein